MKKTSLLFLATLFSLSLFSQNFLSEGKQWNVKLSSGDSYVNTEIFFIEGDSIVNNINYKQFWISTDSLNSATFQGLLRDESEKVYYLPIYGDEGLLYDFGLNVGDTTSIISLASEGEFEIFVAEIDTVEYEGVERKRMLIGREYSGSYEYWIEGIGDNWGPLYTMIYDFIVCPFWELVCVHEYEELIFMLPYTENCYEINVGIDELLQNSKVSLSPNPVQQGQFIEIEANYSIAEIQIYNLTGNHIKTIPSSFTNKQSIKTNDLEKGLYLLKIEMEDGEVLTSKVLVN
ncbi:MAG: T9SS type A sorting domain-containing protein [Bacteroidales bacterium]|nr:T9SS type A sorting domain-containing protein [Bacteroidales bacterium]